MIKSFNHYISGIGEVHIPLFDPAPSIYSLLQSHREIQRLNKLRHLGAIGPAFNGMRQVRWDYTAAMLYFASKLKCYGSSNKSRFISSETSSLNATIQLLALMWNIGHLPGTFGTEKGLLRYLKFRKAQSPVSVLTWPKHDVNYRDSLIDSGNKLIEQRDYSGVARLLAVKKLFEWESNMDQSIRDHFREWIAPFLLQSLNDTDDKYKKIKSAWDLVRHAAYLTIDLPMSGLQWSVNIPSAFDSLCVKNTSDIHALKDEFLETIAPIERQLFYAIYFSDAARKETAILAERIFNCLKNSAHPDERIKRWEGSGLFRELKLKSEKSSSYTSLCTTRWRSYFYFSKEPLNDIEEQIRKKTKQIVLAIEYQPLSSTNTFNAPEVFIDIYGNKHQDPKAVGNVACWLFDKHDEVPLQRSDLSDAIKQDLSKAYFECINKLIALLMPECKLKLDAWPLSRFGINIEGYDGLGIWAVSADLSDTYTKYILRKRGVNVHPTYKAQYNELLGLATLRCHLRKKWGNSKKRQICFLITASTKILKNQKPIIEFDGGLLTISRRSGKVTWYGLESKLGGANPAASLRTRLSRLKIPNRLIRLGTRYAVAEIHIQ